MFSYSFLGAILHHSTKSHDFKYLFWSSVFQNKQPLSLSTHRTNHLTRSDVAMGTPRGQFFETGPIHWTLSWREHPTDAILASNGHSGKQASLGCFQKHPSDADHRESIQWTLGFIIYRTLSNQECPMDDGFYFSVSIGNFDLTLPIGGWSGW
jgi:hypothetical protein